MILLSYWRMKGRASTSTRAVARQRASRRRLPSRVVSSCRAMRIPYESRGLITQRPVAGLGIWGVRTHPPSVASRHLPLKGGRHVFFELRFGEGGEAGAKLGDSLTQDGRGDDKLGMRSAVAQRIFEGLGLDFGQLGGFEFVRF